MPLSPARHRTPAIAVKIHQLPIGARFEYEGEVYVKSGPMLGTGSNGQRLIPKYVVLKPLDGVPSEASPQPLEQLPRTQVMKALEAFHCACLEMVPQDRHPELEAARARCLKSLE